MHILTYKIHQNAHFLLFYAQSNRKALHLQPFHSTIKRYSKFKAGA